MDAPLKCGGEMGRIIISSGGGSPVLNRYAPYTKKTYSLFISHLPPFSNRTHSKEKKDPPQNPGPFLGKIKSPPRGPGGPPAPYSPGPPGSKDPTKPREFELGAPQNICNHDALLYHIPLWARSCWRGKYPRRFFGYYPPVPPLPKIPKKTMKKKKKKKPRSAVGPPPSPAPIIDKYGGAQKKSRPAGFKKTKISPGRPPTFGVWPLLQ